MISAASEGTGGEGTKGLLKLAKEAVVPSTSSLESEDVESLSEVEDSATMRTSSGRGRSSYFTSAVAPEEAALAVEHTNTDWPSPRRWDLRQRLSTT
jgi:hypothetical protein